MTAALFLAFIGIVGSTLAAIDVLDRNLDDHQPPFLPA